MSEMNVSTQSSRQILVGCFILCGASFSLGVLWAKRRKSEKHKGGSESKLRPISEAIGSPPLVARVGRAKELLIKKIARETAELQKQLTVSGVGSIINMSQVYFFE